jgi:hypothetical protein
MKRLAIFALIIMVFFSSGCITGSLIDPPDDVPDYIFDIGSAKNFFLEPSQIGKEWSLIETRDEYAAFELTRQKSFQEKGMSDVAFWKYVNEEQGESVVIWVRMYDAEEDYVKGQNAYHWVYWIESTTSHSLLSDDAKVGIYKPDAEPSRPLMLYFKDDASKSIFLVVYMNTGNNYRADNLHIDKAFVTSIGKKLQAKL